MRNYSILLFPCVDNDINFRQQENMPHLLKRRKYIAKYVVKQLSEHFEKQNAVIFRKVISVGKRTKLLKKVFVLCIQVCAEGSYVFACVKVAFL